MKVLVLGGNGLIGEAVVRALLASGHRAVGLGREVGRARQRLPQAEWLTADIARLSSATLWAEVLQRATPDAIVNCAGALQDGWRDRVDAVQSVAMRALYDAAAAAGAHSFVQISATRASTEADTAFMRSKGEADEALRASRLDWTILRPGLVFAPQAYGGTALLRALASTPVAMPVAHPDSPVQTVWVEDVAAAVVSVIEGRVAARRTYDLVEDEPQPLAAVVTQLRAWLGLAPARVIAIPSVIPKSLARIGDGLGWLGWRTPLRTTAVAELAAGIRGDPAPWRAAAGASLAPLAVTLARMPSTVQERWFARSFLLKPLTIGTLSLFWIATGLIALANHQAAASVLSQRGVPDRLAELAVAAGAAADFILGSAILVRAWCRPAAQGMVLLTLLYLAGGTLLAPDLWADPLGPLLKAVPVLALSLVPLALADDR